MLAHQKHLQGQPPKHELAFINPMNKRYLYQKPCQTHGRSDHRNHKNMQLAGLSGSVNFETYDSKGPLAMIR